MEPRYGAKGQQLKSPGPGSGGPSRRSRRDSGTTARPSSIGTPDGPTGYASVADIDEANGELLLIWNDRAVELGVYPGAIAYNDWVSPNPKPAALDELAACVLGGSGSGAPNPASMSLLRREDPGFTPGGGPSRGEFSDDLNGMVDGPSTSTGAASRSRGRREPARRTGALTSSTASSPPDGGWASRP